MYKYAQIDTATGRCISVSFLSGEIDAEHMIPLADEDVEPGDIYQDGIWTRPEKPAPEPTTADRIAELEAQNAAMLLALVANDLI